MSITKLPGARHVDEDFSLAPQVVESLWNMEEKHFWHRVRNAWILDALREFRVPEGAQVLDVGCGSGAVSLALERAGFKVTGVDTAEHLVNKAALRCNRSSFVIGDVAELPRDHAGPFECIGFFDVLEHLSEPKKLIAGALRWASPGALVIATVPALRALHSVVDDLSGHKRRYERGELAELFARSGLEDAIEHGIFASTLPLQRLQRRRAGASPFADDAAKTRIMVEALRVPAAPVNFALGLVADMERRRGLKAAQGRAGASILGVARVPRSGPVSTA